jgi:hypothetical protein
MQAKINELKNLWLNNNKSSMRYKIKLNKQIKTNYVKLPADSPLRQTLANQSAIC